MHYKHAILFKEDCLDLYFNSIKIEVHVYPVLHLLRVNLSYTLWHCLTLKSQS